MRTNFQDLQGGTVSRRCPPLSENSKIGRGGEDKIEPPRLHNREAFGRLSQPPLGGVTMTHNNPTLNNH